MLHETEMKQNQSISSLSRD